LTIVKLLAKSSSAQLNLESQAVIYGSKSGNIQNALYTTGRTVSSNVQKLFDGAYTNARNTAPTVVKTLPGLIGQSIQKAGNFLGGTSEVVPLIVPKAVFDELYKMMIPYQSGSA